MFKKFDFGPKPHSDVADLLKKPIRVTDPEHSKFGQIGRVINNMINPKGTSVLVEFGNPSWELGSESGYAYQNTIHRVSMGHCEMTLRQFEIDQESLRRDALMQEIWDRTRGDMQRRMKP